MLVEIVRQSKVVQNIGWFVALVIAGCLLAWAA